MRLPVFVKSLLGALGIVAVVFVMVKVCGFTNVRNIFLVLGFVATGLNIFAIANWHPVRLKCKSYPHDRCFFPSHFLFYVGATSLLACLAATAVGFVAGAAVALVAAAVCIFFIFAPKQEEEMGYGFFILFPIVIGTFVVACVAFLFAIFFDDSINNIYFYIYLFIFIYFVYCYLTRTSCIYIVYCYLTRII